MNLIKRGGEEFGATGEDCMLNPQLEINSLEIAGIFIVLVASLAGVVLPSLFKNKVIIPDRILG